MSEKSYKYPKGLDYFEINVLKLLWIIATKDKVKLEDALYLKKLEKELFDEEM